ncbi:AAA family ATPase [Mycobacterium sp. URHB0044]|uniref:AAA family ATPase n=1 Tax=Mycobacterium sp. URHB0044 TaxID=1380386 RepID=UPI00068710F3|nr:LuxR family transcriptional regulator [Mycobacterium sp. URHB0044]
MADGALGIRGQAESDEVAEFLTCASKVPSALVVEGAAGIGKTTFWLAALEQARDRGFRVLSARPTSAGTVSAYAVVADLLTGVEPATWANLPEPQRLAIDRLMLRATDDAVAADPRAIAAAFLAVIERIADQEELILAIDDLQWVDPSSAWVIAFAARRISQPVGIIAAVRTEQQKNPGSWLQMYRPDALRRIDIRPMSLGKLHRVVIERLGRSFTRPTMVRIHRISGGNPFYAIELARAIDDESASPGMRFPVTLSELVRARLDGVDSATQDLLLAAACLGEPTTELLAAAIGADSDDTGTLLERAEKAAILVLDGHRVRFSHPLLSSGVYTSAAPERRRDMHRRLAEIVTEPELHARHLALAATHGDPATLESLDAAAETARIRGAPIAAAELLDLAIGLGGDTPQRRILSAAHHFNAGGASTARAKLIQIVDDPVPGPLRARALNLLGMMSQVEDSLVDGADYLERALANVEDDVELRIQVLVSLAWVQVRLGRLDASAHSIKDAVEHAKDLGQPQLLGRALGMRVTVHMLIGKGLDESSRRRALALDDPRAAIPSVLRPTFHSAMVLAWAGQYDAASDQFAAVRQRCVDEGDESDLVFVSFHSVLNEIWRADFPQAALIAEDAFERAQPLGGALQLSAALTARAIVAAYGGRVTDARRDVGEAIKPISRSGSQLLTGSTVAVLGFLELSLGNYQAAIDALEPLLHRVMAAPDATEIFVAGFLPDAIESLVELGRLAEAEPLIEALEGNGRRLDRPWMLATGGRCRAMLLAARGDLAAATAAVEAAMVEHDRLPMPFERARTQLLLGQLQRRRRMKSAASSTLRSAQQTFEELGTLLWAERAGAELAPVNMDPRSTGDLNAAEQRVAELAASGMTNREVGLTLHVSPKTVEASLSRVYHKLGIRSRAELGRLLGRLPQ